MSLFLITIILLYSTYIHSYSVLYLSNSIGYVVTFQYSYIYGLRKILCRFHQ